MTKCRTARVSIKPIQSRNKASWSLIAGLLVIGMALSGCAAKAVREDTISLAASGQKAMQTVADYYTELETSSRLRFAQEVLNDAFSAITNSCEKALPPSKATSDACQAATKAAALDLRSSASAQSSLHARIVAAVATRKALAGQVAKLYEDIGGLAKKDLGTAMSDQGPALGKALEGVRGTPLDHSQQGLIDKALGSLGDAIQTSQIEKSREAAAQLLATYAEFFTAEQPAWATLGQQLQQIRAQNIVYAVHLGFANTAAAENEMVEVLGLERGSEKLSGNPATAEALTIATSLKSMTAESALDRAGTATARALKELEGATRASPGSATKVDAFAAEAAAYLDIVKKMRDQPKTDPDKSDPK